MNINMLMQQAKKMQNDMEKAKEEVSKKTFTAKQPLVEVEVNGDTEITKINISKDIEKEDIEVLEDMILIATNEAISAAKKEMEEYLNSKILNNCTNATVTDITENISDIQDGIKIKMEYVVNEQIGEFVERGN